MTLVRWSPRRVLNPRLPKGRTTTDSIIRPSESSDSERNLKKILMFSFLVLALTLLVPSLQAQSNPVNGTWSGNWNPKGGIPDAITIELRQEGSKVTGQFLNPAAMEFSKTSFNSKTGALMIEATDKKTGKLYKIDGKIQGNELKGTLAVGDTSGEMRLIKWTFFGR